MSGLSSPGRNPSTDAELVRDLHDRIRRLEMAQTASAGLWTLFTDPESGELKAIRPGIEAQTVDGAVEPKEVDLSAARGYIVQDVANAVWSGVTQQPVDGPGKTLTEMSTALSNIPPASVSSVNGTGNIVDSFAQTWSQLWGGFVRILGGGTGDKSIADAANAAANVATSADTALQLGEWTYAVQELRNNKTLMEGMDETTESNFLLSELLSGTGEPPTISATASSTPMSFWRARETAVKGVFGWYGRGVANITALYIDFYRFDYTTNTVHLFHSSPNQIGQFPADGTWKFGSYFLPVADRFQVNAGDVIGVGWRVVGTGTHLVAGKLGAWLPPDANTIPAKPGAVRPGGTTDITFASMNALYSGNVGWFGLGIADGDIPPPYYAPRQTEISTPGPWSYVIPDWANMVDVPMLGAGGGGAGGDPVFGQAGRGGGAGEWHVETLVRGVDFPATGTTTLTGVVGSGGGIGGVAANGGAGTATTRDAIAGGKAAASAAGGVGGSGGGQWEGYSPGNQVYMGYTYVGGTGGYGAGANPGGPGGAPGAGGGGGAGGTWGIAWTGGGGARGGLWLTARQA